MLARVPETGVERLQFAHSPTDEKAGSARIPEELARRWPEPPLIPAARPA
jgi:hypothetical protein